jgi:hypothetical protein
VIFYPRQRGTPWCIARGEALVHLPGEIEPRDLQPFEVEALIELGRAGELRFVTPIIPAIGRYALSPPPLPTFCLEDGHEVNQLDPAYPIGAFADAAD